MYKEKTDLKTDLKSDLKTDEELIVKLILTNSKITISELSKSIGKGLTVTKENIKKLKNKNILQRIGSDKGGCWKVIKEN